MISADAEEAFDKIQQFFITLKKKIWQTKREPNLIKNIYEKIPQLTQYLTVKDWKFLP